MSLKHLISDDSMVYIQLTSYTKSLLRLGRNAEAPPGLAAFHGGEGGWPPPVPAIGQSLKRKRSRFDVAERAIYQYLYFVPRPFLPPGESVPGIAHWRLSLFLSPAPRHCSAEVEIEIRRSHGLRPIGSWGDAPQNCAAVQLLPLHAQTQDIFVFVLAASFES
jgi:hypothetical protein